MVPLGWKKGRRTAETGTFPWRRRRLAAAIYDGDVE